MSAPVVCPLCAARPRMFGDAHGRSFLECDACGLTFVDPAQRPDPGTERARYASHRNDPADERYRAFLSRLLDPLLARLSPGSEGLDYGSGPGPTLSVMLAEAGHPTAIYDPFFATDPRVLARTYDFITCSETAEHFFEPGVEFMRLDALLRPGGWLAVMTSLREDQPLEEWWYARDPTHVSLYRARTLEWIARRHGWTLERAHPSVALFRKADT